MLKIYFWARNLKMKAQWAFIFLVTQSQRLQISTMKKTFSWLPLMVSSVFGQSSSSCRKYGLCRHYTRNGYCSILQGFLIVRSRFALCLFRYLFSFSLFFCLTFLFKFRVFLMFFLSSPRRPDSSFSSSLSFWVCSIFC